MVVVGVSIRLEVAFVDGVSAELGGIGGGAALCAPPTPPPPPPPSSPPPPPMPRSSAPAPLTARQRGAGGGRLVEEGAHERRVACRADGAHERKLALRRAVAEVRRHLRQLIHSCCSASPRSRSAAESRAMTGVATLRRVDRRRRRRHRAERLAARPAERPVEQLHRRAPLQLAPRQLVQRLCHPARAARTRSRRDDRASTVRPLASSAAECISCVRVSVNHREEASRLLRCFELRLELRRPRDQAFMRDSGSARSGLVKVVAAKRGESQLCRPQLRVQLLLHRHALVQPQAGVATSCSGAAVNASPCSTWGPCSAWAARCEFGCRQLLLRLGVRLATGALGPAVAHGGRARSAVQLGRSLGRPCSLNDNTVSSSSRGARTNLRRPRRGAPWR